MDDLSHFQKVAITVIGALLAAWIGWVSWTLTQKETETNVRILLADEIRRSTIKDDMHSQWLLSQSVELKDLGKTVAGLTSKVDHIHKRNEHD